MKDHEDKGQRTKALLTTIVLSAIIFGTAGLSALWLCVIAGVAALCALLIALLRRVALLRPSARKLTEL